MELRSSQSAIILEEDENGEISVNVATGDQSSLTARICGAIATRLMSDEQFQTELMDMLDQQEE